MTYKSNEENKINEGISRWGNLYPLVPAFVYFSQWTAESAAKEEMKNEIQIIMAYLLVSKSPFPAPAPIHERKQNFQSLGVLLLD